MEKVLQISVVKFVEHDLQSQPAPCRCVQSVAILIIFV